MSKQLHDLYGAFVTFDESDLNKIHELLDEAFDKGKIEERLYDNLKHYTYAAVPLGRSAVDLAVGKLAKCAEDYCNDSACEPNCGDCWPCDFARLTQELRLALEGE